MNSRRRRDTGIIRVYYIIWLRAVGVVGLGPRGRVPQKASRRDMQFCICSVILLLHVFENYEKLSVCKHQNRNVFSLNNYNIMPTP